MPAATSWPAVAYFSLWSVRLTGVLPELRVSHETAEIVEEMFGNTISQLDPARVDQSHRQPTCAAR